MAEKAFWQDFIDETVTSLKVAGYDFLTWLMDSASELLKLIPVPGFMENLPTYVDNIPAGVLWLLHPFEIPFGLSLIMAALTARYLFSLVPFVGGGK